MATKECINKPHAKVIILDDYEQWIGPMNDAEIVRKTLNNLKNILTG